MAIHSSVIEIELNMLPFPSGGTILQYSVVKMSNVQMMVSAMMDCGGLIVHACLVLQEAGKLTFERFGSLYIKSQTLCRVQCLRRK